MDAVSDGAIEAVVLARKGVLSNENKTPGSQDSKGDNPQVWFCSIRWFKRISIWRICIYIKTQKRKSDSHTVELSHLKFFLNRNFSNTSALNIILTNPKGNLASRTRVQKNHN